MIAALKALHLLALAVALGFGIARLLLARRMTPETAPALAPALGLLGRIAPHAVLLLWLTGLALWGLDYGFGAVNGWFHLKLVAATLLAGLALFSWSRMRAGRPPAPPLALRLGQASVASGIVAVIAATYAFGG